MGYFRALGARVVSSAIWFVADVLELTVGAVEGPTGEVTTDGSLGAVKGEPKESENEVMEEAMDGRKG